MVLGLVAQTIPPALRANLPQPDKGRFVDNPGCIAW